MQERGRQNFMSEHFTFHEPGKDEDMSSLMRGIDLQLSLMKLIKSHIESYLYSDAITPYANEPSGRYGKGGYMADYILDDNDVVSEVRYDWVKE